MNEKTTSKAVVAIQKVNHAKKFLRAGSEVERRGNHLQIQWNGQITGKSLYSYFRAHFQGTLGPGGNCPPTDFQPVGLRSNQPELSPRSNQSGSQPLATTQEFPTNITCCTGTEPQTAAIGAGTKTEIAALGAGLPGYPPMPAKWAKACFGVENWWKLDQVRYELDEMGFICLLAFLPKVLVDKCFGESTEYFFKVLRSFWGGFAIDKGLAGLDDVAALPPKVWEKYFGDPVTVLFPPGPWGFRFDPATKQVIAVGVSSYAEHHGVKTGWVVLDFQADGASIHPDPILFRLGTSGFIEGFVELGVVFRQDVCYSPFALTQKWGCSTSRGYQPLLGLGKCTNPEFVNSPASLDAQLYMRNFLANVHNCLPHELCWQPDGNSFKAGRSFFRKMDLGFVFGV
jgi:hypothetical protein